MEIDEQSQQELKMPRIIRLLKSQHWQNKKEAFEIMLKSLIDLSSGEIADIYVKSKKEWREVAELLVEVLETETAFNLLECALDFLEFSLSAMPELVFDFLDSHILILLKLT